MTAFVIYCHWCHMYFGFFIKIQKVGKRIKCDEDRRENKQDV